VSGNVPAEENTAARNMGLIAVDAQDAEEYSKNWCKIINIGRAEVLLDSNMQQQLLTMKEELGFSYVRIWNIFVEDMYDEENGWNYNFVKTRWIFLIRYWRKRSLCSRRYLASPA